MTRAKVVKPGQVVEFDWSEVAGPALCLEPGAFFKARVRGPVADAVRGAYARGFSLHHVPSSEPYFLSPSELEHFEHFEHVRIEDLPDQDVDLAAFVPYEGATKLLADQPNPA